MVTPHLIGTALVLHAAVTIAARPEVLVEGLEAAAVVGPDAVDARWCERFAQEWLVSRRGCASASPTASDERITACLARCSTACAAGVERALRQDAADELLLDKATMVLACRVSAVAQLLGCWTVTYEVMQQTWYGPMRGPRTRVSGHLTLVLRSVQAGDTDVLAVDDDHIDAQEDR